MLESSGLVFGVQDFFGGVRVNLVVNARDAMPHGGTLTIETGNFTREAPERGRYDLLSPGRYARFSITDTGTGMEREVLDHLFEPFFTTKPEGKGTGLGLATCYGIVQQNGGHINITSAPNRGSTFEVLLPCASELPEDLSPASIPELPTGSETVLLVEDRPEVRRLAAETLRGQGYSVIEAENGENALEQIAGYYESEAIDLLLTDVIMPRMGGKALADEFHKTHPATPVLFTSASQFESEVGRAMEQGWGSFLQKPYTPRFLACKVREVLDAFPDRGE